MVGVVTLRVESALPVPIVVVAHTVDGEVAHVVQSGVGGPTQADNLIVATAGAAIRTELKSSPCMFPFTLTAV